MQTWSSYMCVEGCSRLHLTQAMGRLIAWVSCRGVVCALIHAYMHVLISGSCLLSCNLPNMPCLINSEC